MRVKKLVVEPSEKRAAFWIEKTNEETWASDAEIRELCKEEYPCEIDGLSILDWMKPNFKVVHIDMK